MPIAAHELSRLLDRIYQAALDPLVWPSAMQGISDAVGSGLSGLVVLNKRSGTFPLTAGDPRNAAEAIEDYTRHYAHIDELRGYARSRPAGEVTVTADVSRDLLRRSQCYNDFYVRWDLKHFVGSYLVNDSTCEASLVVYRSDSEGGEYSQDEVATIQLLVPHVTRALEVSRRLHVTSAETRQLYDALDMVGQGVVLLDRRGAVTWMNAAASDLVKNDDGIGVDPHGLRIDDSAAMNMVRRVAGGAGASSLELAEGCHVAAARPSGRAPYRIMAAPIRPALDCGFSPHTAAIVFIADPTRVSRRSRTALQALYGLTPVEAEMAGSLAEGKSIQEFAAERQISIETVRTHLKRVMQKTGTHKQAQLVTLLLQTA